MKLKFLGTGGGRYVTASQRRKTAGIILETDEQDFFIDPGPGALVESTGLCEDVKSIVVSHNHLEHANDAQALIERVAYRHENSLTLYGSKSVIKGHGELERFVSGYHQDLCTDVKVLEDSSFSEEGLEVESQVMFHTDPTCAGFKVSSESETIGFWTDSEFSEELTGFYSDCDTLVVYCSRPRGKTVKGHLSLDQVPEIAEGSEASTLIVTHFGYKFLEQDLDEEKAWLEKKVEQKVVFADDGMEFPGNRKLGSF